MSTIETVIAAHERFIRRWQGSGSGERANTQTFLGELCGLLGVPRPDPARADDAENAYVFEKPVRFDNADGTHTTGFIDLYKRGCFVLEAKQGSDVTEDAPLFGAPAGARTRRGTATRGTHTWDVAMERARGQAEQYVRALPAAEGNPPFILVVDVGHTFELFADFSRLGKTYTPFPDSRTFRFRLEDLSDESIRRRLAMVWTDPLSLDPARHSAKVTRDVAAKLAALARSLEKSGHHPEAVAQFLMRCLFTFFAEDARLIERDPNRPEEQPFTDLLKSLKGHPDRFIPMVQDVWKKMDAGGFSTAIAKKLKHFNGKLFKECDALALSDEQLDLLIDAGRSDWSDVEPAIFGTLLERALDERERHKLGAHYTPRAYVERLVLPTVIEPLREQFDAAKAAAFTLSFQGKAEDARKAVRDFLAMLCHTTVLDPACGSGNFLYVTMEHMKRLEGEARGLLKDLGETQELLERAGLTVDPHQFMGLEINPRAVAIAELVLWIGYLKWHLRTLGHAPGEPLLKDFHNIVEQDAVLAYDAKELLRDEHGKPVTRWDGRTTKTSPVTGEDIPDESARVPVYRYINPRKAEWPKAEYVVGNPPFIGAKYFHAALGVGYAEALRRTYAHLNESIDLVMYWWDKAANLAVRGAIKRFGFITTNSLRQSFSRSVVAQYVGSGKPLSLRFAAADHPWVESSDGAAVRIAMTVAALGQQSGRLIEIVKEEADDEGAFNLEVSSKQLPIEPDLTPHGSADKISELRANADLANRGVALFGSGFIVTSDQARELGLGRVRGLEHHIRRYRNGRDLTDKCREALVIDLFGLSIDEVRKRFPEVYQHVLNHVKPERDVNPREVRRRNWWLFGETNPKWRWMSRGLQRFIATPATAKHRIFTFLPNEILPDDALVSIAIEDAVALGVLSSRAHLVWARFLGTTLEDRPRYVHSTCFEPFPFPVCTDAQAQKIRELGEALDAHRKRQQAAHPGLTITDMYNVLEKLRRGEELSAKDKRVHEQGLVSVLRQIHDDLDAAVFDAYGWPRELTDEQILQRLVALNHERADEEKRGLIRWLRPEFQNPAGTAAVQATLELPEAEDKQGKQRAGKAAKKPPFPKALPEQAWALRAALSASAAPVSPEQLAGSFAGARAERVRELLETLVTLGQARPVEAGKFVA
jgi:hypothetical protein